MPANSPSLVHEGKRDPRARGGVRPCPRRIRRHTRTDPAGRLVRSSSSSKHANQVGLIRVCTQHAQADTHGTAGSFFCTETPGPQATVARHTYGPARPLAGSCSAPPDTRSGSAYVQAIRKWAEGCGMRLLIIDVRAMRMLAGQSDRQGGSHDVGRPATAEQFRPVVGFPLPAVPVGLAAGS